MNIPYFEACILYENETCEINLVKNVNNT